jgi:hypothetical protein
VEVGPIAVRVGGLIIGVRTNDEAVHDLLLAALRPLVVADVEAPPNLSLALGEDDGRVRGLHFLYRGGLSVVRTSSRGRLLRAALRHLEGFATPPPETTPLNAKLLLRDDDAMLVDDRFGGTVDVLERRLHRMGLHLVDVHAPMLDRDTMEVMLEPPHLDFDADGRAEIDRRHPPASHEVELHDARYRLRGLVVWGDPEPDGRSPAQRYAELTALAADRHGNVDADDLDLLARLPNSCEVVRIAYPDARQLLSALRGLR